MPLERSPSVFQVLLKKKKYPKRKRALDYSSGRVIKVTPLSHSEEIKPDNRIWQRCSQTQPEPRGVDGSPSHVRDERLESSTVVNLVIVQGQVNVTPRSACFGLEHAQRCMKCAASIHHMKLVKGVDGRLILAVYLHYWWPIFPNYTFISKTSKTNCCLTCSDFTCVFFFFFSWK